MPEWSIEIPLFAYNRFAGYDRQRWDRTAYVTVEADDCEDARGCVERFLNRGK